MPRVKRGVVARRRRNKVMKAAKGFRGGHRRLFKTATEAVDRALKFAYRDRRQRKRQMRNLWVMRINAAARQNGMSYSVFIGGLQRTGVALDRKVLADIAVKDPAGFTQLVEKVRAAA